MTSNADDRRPKAPGDEEDQTLTPGTSHDPQDQRRRETMSKRDDMSSGGHAMQRGRQDTEKRLVGARLAEVRSVRLTEAEWQRKIEKSNAELMEYTRTHLLISCFEAPVECPRVERALYEVSMRLPEEVVETVDATCLCIYYGAISHAKHHMRQVWLTDAQRRQVAKGGFCECDWWSVVLESALEEQPYDLIVATVAHELAHMVLGHDDLDDSETVEFDACAEAIRWGFGEETLAMVRDEASAGGDLGGSWQDCVNRLDELETIAAECEQHRQTEAHGDTQRVDSPAG